MSQQPHPLGLLSASRLRFHLWTASCADCGLVFALFECPHDFSHECAGIWRDIDEDLEAECVGDE